MKKNKILIIGIVAIIAIAFLTLALQSNAKQEKLVEKRQAKPQACKILTATAAHSVLGNNMQPVTDKSSVSDGIATDTCTYKQIGTDTLQAQLTLHSPVTAGDKAAVKTAFEKHKGKNQKLAIYGDDGFWDAKAGQLHVYKHDTWYTLQSGASNASDRNLSQTEELADILADKF